MRSPSSVLPFANALAFLIVALVSSATQASAGATIDFDDARHLLTRTGFAPTFAEVRGVEGRTRAAAIDALLAAARSAPTLSPPPWTATSAPPEERPRPGMTVDERKVLQQHERSRIVELRGWWLAEMQATPSPLTERMTLFWHNHFATSEQKVRDARLMYAQNALFRREALGSFATLLHAVARDPAMLIWLDGARNRRGAPNENFAREAMELFTLGEGHYAQPDVAQAARAFTGFGVDRASEQVVFRPRLHDNGTKTLLGMRGDFDTDGALDVLLARPETATFVVDKLWREFVSPQPDARVVERIAGDFRASHYAIKVALRELLLSDAFWDAQNRGTLVKSPAELVVGTLRAVDVEPDDMRPIVTATARMGEVLFAPPNVRGWPGGDAWINSSTLLARKSFLARVTRAMPASAMAASSNGAAPSKGVEWQHLLLPLPAVGDAVVEAMAEREPAAVIRAALLDPVYQLK
ncbi:MAG: DUF1800 domain-containing protein [Casimicrobiaceae bacterium]